MTKKITKIRFRDFDNEVELLQYFIENSIQWIEYPDGTKIHYSESLKIWQENKPEDLKKFKS